jgi:uncharacterized protein YciW
VSRLNPLEGDGESPGLKELFAEMQLHLEIDEVPTMLRMLGHSPKTLKGLWTFMQAVLTAHGSVSNTTKNLVALAAASAADAGHLRDWLRKSLVERGIDQAMLNDLVEKGETLRLPERTQKILVFARRAALDPKMLQAEDFGELSKAGLSSEDIAELVGFSGLVSCLIAITRALGLTDDPTKKSKA